MKRIETSGISCGLCRTSNAFDLSYSNLPDRDSLDGLDRFKLIMSNKIGSLVFTEYFVREMSRKMANNECTIAIVVVLDT